MGSPFALTNTLRARLFAVERRDEASLDAPLRDLEIVFL